MRHACCLEASIKGILTHGSCQNTDSEIGNKNIENRMTKQQLNHIEGHLPRLFILVLCYRLVPRHLFFRSRVGARPNCDPRAHLPTA